MRTMEETTNSHAAGPSSGTPRLSSERKRHLLRRIVLVASVVMVALTAIAASQKDRYAYHLAEASRDVLGSERTARLESWYFAAQDRIDRTKFALFGGDTNPFDDVAESIVPVEYVQDEEPDFTIASIIPEPVVVEPARPPPLVLPETKPLRPSLADGEGVWTTAGLPHSSPDDVLMAKTFVRPDPTRPYATVGVLLLDKRRILLHLTGGTEDPGGDRGVKGPGTIPVVERPNLLVAWNGGFKGPHGGYGMVADGKTYRPLRAGYASVAVLADGTVQMGQWGRDLNWRDDIVAVRQNAVLLVENCEVSRRTSEGNDTWGYVQVNSSEFITWRSAIGLTSDGDLLVAAGNSLSAATLAKALWAAGACTAMQLDINTPYVLTSLFFSRDDGSLRSARFMDSMADNPARFLSTQPRDFMYVTLDESRFVP